jgi:hypothetical protein
MPLTINVKVELFLYIGTVPCTGGEVKRHSLLTSELDIDEYFHAVIALPPGNPPPPILCTH